jgi:hypothetical protein
MVVQEARKHLFVGRASRHYNFCRVGDYSFD